MSKPTRKTKRIKQPAKHPVTPVVPLDTGLVTPPENREVSRIGKWTHAWIAALLIALPVGLYTWTVDFPMVFDDYSYLIDNPVFRDASGFSYLTDFNEFANLPTTMGIDPDYAVNFILRPVAYATFHLNYAFDEFNPRWYRAFNIVIHALNSLLIYGLITTLLRRATSHETLSRGSLVFIPATTALIFAAHPLAIESVTYIIQRFTSLVVLFSLLALWLHFLSLSAASRCRLRLLRSGSVVAMLLAMQTKECSFTIPFLAVLLDWIVLRSSLRSSIAKALPLLLCAPLIPILVILTTTAQNGGRLDWGASFNVVNSRDVPLNHWHYIVTQFTVVLHYLKLLFWPAGLNVDPEWPVYVSLVQKPVALALGILTSLMAAVWWMFRRYRNDVRMALAFVGALWFVITISISSGLVPLPDMMAEHRSYLPSIGIFMIVAAWLDMGRSLPIHRVVRCLAPASIAAIIVALSWATTSRNEVWRTSESLWKDAVAKSPGKFRTWGNLGTAYSSVGKEKEAVKCYRQAVQIEPRFQAGLLNLSNSLLRLNQPKESLNTTMKLMELDPSASSKPPVAFALGLGLTGVGRYDEAAFVFRELLTLFPNDVGAHKAIGWVYGQIGLLQRALEHYHHAITLQPDDQHLPAVIAATEQALASKRLNSPNAGPGIPLRLRSD